MSYLSPRNNEERMVGIGRVGDRTIAVNYTMRESNIRIISARIARRKERKLYMQWSKKEKTMSRLVRMTLEEAKRISSKTDWERVDAMTDEEIEKAIKEDTDSAPELTEEWFKNAQWVRERKESIPVYLDHSVAEFLKHRGANYHF